MIGILSLREHPPVFPRLDQKSVRCRTPQSLHRSAARIERIDEHSDSEVDDSQIDPVDQYIAVDEADDNICGSQQEQKTPQRTPEKANPNATQICPRTRKICRKASRMKTPPRK